MASDAENAPTPDMASEEADQEQQDHDQDDDLSLTLQYHGQPLTLTLPKTCTITDLSTLISTDLDIPPSNQKLLISPKPGLMRPPFKDPSLPLSTLLLSPTTKIILLGTSAKDLSDLSTAIAALKAKQQARSAAQSAGRKVQAYRHGDWKRDAAAAAITHTFMTLRPLPYLPNPEKSLRYLQRLAADPGIKAVMQRKKYTVGLLTEMDPAAHTTHDSRTLGLNRDRGQVIELRLRTDAYDGYRDYKTIRRTLCHELAHNEIGPHNQEFHRLWNEIEKEVERSDWSRGGRSVGQDEFYSPSGGGDDHVLDDEHCDAGGWEGGSYVLGGESSSASASTTPLDRREVMAKAAEARANKQNGVQETRDTDGNPPSI
jgi:hypothetical protein